MPSEASAWRKASAEAVAASAEAMARNVGLYLKSLRDYSPGKTQETIANASGGNWDQPKLSAIENGRVHTSLTDADIDSYLTQIGLPSGAPGRAQVKRLIRLMRDIVPHLGDLKKGKPTKP